MPSAAIIATISHVITVINIPFIINGIVSATYKTRGLPVKERIIPVGNRTTMLTIQLETYHERKLTSDIAY